jgi:hypothetical protein
MRRGDSSEHRYIPVDNHRSVKPNRQLHRTLAARMFICSSIVHKPVIPTENRGASCPLEIGTNREEDLTMFKEADARQAQPTFFFRTKPAPLITDGRRNLIY